MSISSLAAIDIYPNPNLTDPSLATTFASQLRNMKIKEMEQVVKGECNQFKEYAYLSIQNWKSFKNQTKSADEAQQYSQQLVREIPYRLSFQYTFPLGIEIYSTTEEYIKQTTLGRQKLNENNFLNQMYSGCLSMNNSKYFDLLSSKKYLIRNQNPFISESDVLKMFDPTNSMFGSIQPVPSKEDKLTPPNMTKVINFKPIEFVIAHMLIDQDIRNSFITSDISWIDYKKASINMQKNFAKFMKEGGRNKDFAKIASLIKILSPKITNNDENYIMPTEAEISSVFNTLNLDDDPVLSKNLKDNLKKFNY
jgi:hypothetical protein